MQSWADGLAHPERFVGIHFFNPVRKMKLVEVIRGKDTSDETVATAVAYAKRNGIAYQVHKEQKPKTRSKAYADNFKWGRHDNWTH